MAPTTAKRYAKLHLEIRSNDSDGCGFEVNCLATCVGSEFSVSVTVSVEHLLNLEVTAFAESWRRENRMQNNRVMFGKMG
jgi:hypothetical protein